ncbi:MAG: hypothetical protein JSS69_18455 [Acidobacteria bacterium]|nr:hypothetical protein [Acidobacteriota bacterium]MBS1867897.1 hypothetical protein [Acidobacteriota bacterium]
MMAPATVDAVLLLGWMEKDEAVACLLDQCFFDGGIDRAKAESLWQHYYDLVQALPERKTEPTKRHPIPPGNKGLVTDFLRRHRPPEVADVVNINPMDLIAYQTYVVTDRANHHNNQIGGWARKTLVIDRPIAQLPMRIEGDTIKFSLPHAEHTFAFQNGALQIQQFAGFVSVADIGGGRLLLKAGYHRSFAFARAVMNEPDAKDKCELVALTTSLPPQLARSSPHQGLRTIVFGSRPPLFSDFFDPDLAMTVKLLRKRWEAHLRIATIDDP